MVHRAGVMLIVLLVAAISASGCLSRLWSDLDEPDTTVPVTEPGTTATEHAADPAPDPAPDAAPTGQDDWQEAYERWHRCPRSGGPITPCQHPHPVTESVAPGPAPERISVRHHVTNTSWTATIHAVDEALPYRALRLDFLSPDTGGSLYDQHLPSDGTLHFRRGMHSDCVDCGTYQRMTDAPYPQEEHGYRLRIVDLDNDGQVTPGDTFTIDYEASNTSNSYHDPFPEGRYVFRLDGRITATIPLGPQAALHTPLTTTSDMRAPGWTLTVRHDTGTLTPPSTTATVQLPDLVVTVPLPDDGNTSRTVYISYNEAVRYHCRAHDTCISDEAPRYGPAYRLTFHDANGDGRFMLGDHIRLDHDVGNRTYGPRTWNHPFPFGHYQIDLHGPDNTTSATGGGHVYDGRTPSR